MPIAASGMRAATVGLDAAAANIANMRDSGPVPATPDIKSLGRNVPQQSGNVYQTQDAQQTPAPGGNVFASLGAALPSCFAAFDPNASFANARGMVAEPNVDPATQFANMALARTAFSANLAVFRAGEQTYRTLLDVVA